MLLYIYLCRNPDCKLLCWSYG